MILKTYANQSKIIIYVKFICAKLVSLLNINRFIALCLTLLEILSLR
jgi:hypothetical protein